MTEVLTYVEVDIPFCTRTYSFSPCNARAATENDPVAASFNGSTAYLKRAGGLTGAADSKTITISCWVKRTAGAVARVVFNATTALNGTTQRTSAGIDSSGAFFVQGYNAAGTLILDQRSSVIVAGRWIHVLASFDLSSGSKRHIYIDDTSDIAAAAAFTNDTIDFTMADWGIGGTPGGTLLFTGELGDLWIAPGVYLDLTVEANRRKFITVDGSRDPVDLGATGSIPTGTAPLIFMSGDDVATWPTNKGTGGGFTLTGTLPSGEFSTGALKCFNSIKTCQDRESFDEDDVTLRFAKPTEYLPSAIDCIPSIESVSYSPAIVSLGVNLGQRASLTVTFRDHPHSDTGTGYDKYLDERDYDPWSQGTYWGKFRARQPFLQGRALRWIIGRVGEDLADMETRTFLIESFSGPTPDGKFTISAKDVLKLADGDRSQAPALSNGFLSANIDASVTTASLLPSGIGNAEYPASGYATIGGSESIAFTRSADVLTFSRAALGTVASAHKAQDRVQLALIYSGVDAANILNDLAVNYAGIPASYIDVAEWLEETAAFLGSVYSTAITEPTPVSTLSSELVEQAALSIWDDPETETLQLRVLRAITTDAFTFSPENTLKGSLQIKEQPEKRLSRVHVYFGQKDPTKPLSNLDNYRSVSRTVDEDAEADYGAQSIKTVLSRWIPEGGMAIADRLGAIILGRYRDPPRQVQFSLQRFAETDAELGVGYRVETDCVQDATGAQSDIPIQVTRLNPGPDRFSVEAEEMLWTAPAADTGTRYVIYDSNNVNRNLRTSHDALYPTPVAGDVVNCIVNAGVTIGSNSYNLNALDIGSWPAGVTINLTVDGTVQGCGGYGGEGGSVGGAGNAGAAGGTALYTRYPINLSVTSGDIWGGGGGGGGGASGGRTGLTGGGGGGGGGAGTLGGAGGAGGGGNTAGGNNGAAGTPTGGSGGGVGGATGTGEAPLIAGGGGQGGGPGLAGNNGDSSTFNFVFVSPGGGGAAGNAIDGVSYVTVTAGPGDIRGGQVN